MTILKIAAYSNPITAPVMLLATTIQIPVAIISSAKKCLAQAKDFVLNSIPAAQLFLVAAIGYYVFHSTTVSYEEVVKEIKNGNHNALNDAMRHDKNAQEVLNHKNTEGLNLPQQNAKDGDFKALDTVVRGSNNGFINIVTRPLANIADGILHYSGADKLPMIKDRTKYKGLTTEQINQQISTKGKHEGKTVTHLAASTFQNKQDLKVIDEMHKRGADPSIEDQDGKTAMDLAFENNKKEVSNKDVVEVLTNHGEHFAATMNRAINQDKTVQVDAHFENAESKNWTIFGLNIGPNNAGKLLTQTDQNGSQPLTVAIKKENLPVIGRLQGNKVFAKNEQAVEVSKLVDAKPTEENIKLEIELLKNTNDKETVEAMNAVVTNQQLTTLCNQREEAIANPCNQNPLKIAATGTRKNGITPSDVKSYMENETVPTSHKVFSAIALVPHAPTMVNDVIVSDAVSTTSKVAGWVGNFLADVCEELGKAIILDYSDLATTTPQDYATSTHTPAINPYSSWMIDSVSAKFAIELAPTNQLLELTGSDFDPTCFELMVD